MYEKIDFNVMIASVKLIINITVKISFRLVSMHSFMIQLPKLRPY